MLLSASQIGVESGEELFTKDLNGVMEIEQPESKFRSVCVPEIQERRDTSAEPETSKFEESLLKLPISKTEV